MIDELRKDYVRTLRTRGIARHARSCCRHALRNAGSPALTVLSLEFIQMFGGALIIENVFALPGFGQYAFNASLQGDVPVILGITAFGVLLVIVRQPRSSTWPTAGSTRKRGCPVECRT